MKSYPNTAISVGWFSMARRGAIVQEVDEVQYLTMTTFWTLVAGYFSDEMITSTFFQRISGEDSGKLRRQYQRLGSYPVRHPTAEASGGGGGAGAGYRVQNPRRYGKYGNRQ
jgi:hypothetical protein